MRMSSLGTGGARRRHRWHAGEHRRLAYRGRHGEQGGPGAEWVFELHADDGRTYILRLNAGDVDELRAAGLTREGQAALALGEDGR